MERWKSSLENMVTTKRQIETDDISYIHKKANLELGLLANHDVLITGAGGFLGYYFIKTFHAWNIKNPEKKIGLTVLSTFRNGVPDWLQALNKEKSLILLKADISTFELSKKKHYDYIIHGASIASPTFYRLYPVETINANVQGLYKILDYVVAKRKSSPIIGLLYFSSSEIYGDPLKGNIPTPETYRGNVSCTGPRACYDESKRFCETLCVNYSKVYDLPIKSARPFNNYGPGMKITDGRVIADFCRNILKNEDIVMFSNGSPQRTFCYVTDAIVGYLKILTKGKQAEAYNIGVATPEITVANLAKKLIAIGRKEFDYKGKLIKIVSKDKAYLTDNPQRRCPDISKAKKQLGYNPTVSLANGLYKTIMWYKG